MLLNRTMRQSDYEELKPELDILDKTIAVVGPVPYKHRYWEYALTIRAVREYFKDRKIVVADFGCETGLSPSIMLMQGHQVFMYETWEWGNRQGDAEDKAKHAASAAPNTTMWGFVNRPLGGLIDADKHKFDLALCISVMEHIPNEVAAFNDLLDSVNNNGMAILTVDFAPDLNDHYHYKEIRSRIYNPQRLFSLLDRAKDKGFELYGTDSDWTWEPDRKMVQNEYGFAAMVLVKQ